MARVIKEDPAVKSRLDTVLEKKQKEHKTKASLIHERVMPPRQSKYKPVDLKRFHPRLASYLRLIGFKFWSHQADAIESALDGDNVVIATPTASGKSICYLYPVINELLNSRLDSSALFIFPLKALAQDQYQKIRKIFATLGIPQNLVGVYDADTSADEKRYIRNNCKVIITNPYGFHMYLGNHRLWKKAFEKLKFIVFDEIHVYTGVFGSNVAFLLRRIKRITNSYKTNPQWIFSSATIGNPGELAEKLTGLPFTVVDNDGSNAPSKRLWLWNPVFNQSMNRRNSTHLDTREMFHFFIKNQFQTLLFSQSRKMAELQAKWAMDYFKGKRMDGKIMPYRAGYPAQKRRLLEKMLRDRKLMGISATSALELGIDIGSLDVVIISGFPGSMMSFWQQAGRCGRVLDDSLVVFCAGSDALDQYYITHPEMFFNGKHEDAIINLENPHILRGHLSCAIKELPISDSELYYFGPKAHEIAKQMLMEGTIQRIGNKYFYALDDFPAWSIPLNAIPSETYSIFEIRADEKVYLTSETENRVFSTLHDGAIFLYMGETYRVIHLDLDNKVVDLKREDVNYYTEQYNSTEITPYAGGDAEKGIAINPEDLIPVHTITRGKGLEAINFYFGDVIVEKQFNKYAEKTIKSGEVISYHRLDLPKTKFTTKSIFFTIPKDIYLELVESGKKSLGGGIHAIEHGIIALFPKNIFCSRWDVGGVSIDVDPLFNRPAIYIYDSFPGGIGLSEKATEMIVSLLNSTREMIRGCSCKPDNGCPSCVQSPRCGNGNEPISKKGALSILDAILHEEP
ncbi:MAG: DEAD/DEAH box helicase [Promethearchaeota archaeon]